MILQSSISLFYDLTINLTSSYYCYIVLVTSKIFKYLKTKRKVTFHQLENCTLVTIDLGIFFSIILIQDGFLIFSHFLSQSPKRKNDQHPIQENARKGMHSSMEKSYRVSSPHPLTKSMQFRQPSNLQLEQPNFLPDNSKEKIYGEN